MFRSCVSVWVAAIVLTASGCQTGRHSADGFRLPPSGDAVRGKTAFVAHQCYNCHAVDGVNLPPAALMATAVALGGELPRQITDGYLVTSIINPSHVVSGYAKSDAAVPGSAARMPDFADDLTVRELTDIVAFLHTRYSVQRAPRYPSSL